MSIRRMIDLNGDHFCHDCQICKICQQQVVSWIYFIVIVHPFYIFHYKNQVRDNQLIAEDLLGTDVENKGGFEIGVWIRNFLNRIGISKFKYQFERSEKKGLDNKSIGFPVCCFHFPCPLLYFFSFRIGCVFTLIFEASYEIEEHHQLRINRK